MTQFDVATRSVQVQEEIVELLGNGRSAAVAVLETSTKYFAMRAALVSKVLKYPSVQDYTRWCSHLTAGWMAALCWCAGWLILACKSSTRRSGRCCAIAVWT